MNVAGRKVAGKLAAKAALRFIPGLGALLTAYELYQWITQPVGEVSGGVLHFQGATINCEKGGLGVAARPPGTSHGPLASAPCGGGNSAIPVLANNAVIPAGWKSFHFTKMQLATGSNRYRLWQCKTHAAQTSVWVRTYAGLRTWFDPNRMPWETPLFEPWLDPSIPHPLHPPLAKREPGRDPYRDPWEYPLPTKDPIIFPQPAYPGNPYGPWWKPKPRRRRRVRQPQPKRRRLPMPKPRIPPWMDPFPQPRVPVPQPVSDPPPPFPGVVTAPIVGPAPAPGFGVAPLPPGRMPDWEWTLVAQPQLGIAPRLRPRPPGPAPVRPVPSGKERKVGMSALGYGWALWLFNFATESRDAIEAFVKALPCERQRALKNASPAEKLGAIYINFEELDAEAALTELLLNHIEDFVIGRAHGAISKGFGSGKNWENYLRSVQASHLFSDAAKSGAKGLNRALDQFAKSLSLKRVQCGRR